MLSAERVSELQDMVLKGEEAPEEMTPEEATIFKSHQDMLQMYQDKLQMILSKYRN